MKKCSKSAHESLTEMNITPLLDLAFVLLVIFIISTAPMVNDLDLNLPPRTQAPKPAADKKPNLIIVEANGQVMFNGKQVELTALKKDLALMAKADTNTSVVVHGDLAVVYQNMVNLFDILQQANVTKVGLATERPAGAPPPPSSN